MSDYYYHNGRLYNSDELQHWKYIKKKKVNGKWRYYYDTESLKDDVKDKLGYDERERMRESAREYGRALNEQNNAKSEVDRIHDQRKSADTTQKAAENLVELLKADKISKEAYYKAREAGHKYAESQKEFMNTPLGKLESLQKNIKKGAEKVASLFSKLFGKKR